MQATVYFHIIFIVIVAGVTVLLSLTVFMNIVSELMPITSDAVPLIGNMKLFTKQNRVNICYWQEPILTSSRAWLQALWF